MFICTECQHTALKWSGQCSQCQAWNTLIERTDILTKKTKLMTGQSVTPTVLEPKSAQTFDRKKSASGELDGVLGGGLVPGSLILLSGEPGIGKSTLALQMADWYARDKGDRVLYISGEESTMQIAGRANRFRIQNNSIDVLSESDFEIIAATIENSPAHVIIIDSISVLSASSLEGAIGSITQIRAMTEACMHLAKKLTKSIIIIGHVTKDGSISGPKSLEHLVDVVLYLEGIRTENYRLLRAWKNRFGPTDNVGIFRMEETGLIDIIDPGVEFIDETNLHLAGSALSMTIEGSRPILIEIEALTTSTKFGYPKRSVRGIPAGKLDLLIAVMIKYISTRLDNADVYLNVARGITLREPGCDLAAIAAIMSSKIGKSLGRTLYFGEVSLTGVVKPVLFLEKRLHEAKKLGFTRVCIPERYDGKIPKDMELIRVSHVRELEKTFS